MSNHIDTRRQSLSRRAILYLLSAISVCSIEIGSVRAAYTLQPEPPGQYSDSSSTMRSSYHPQTITFIVGLLLTTRRRRSPTMSMLPPLPFS